MQLAVTESTKYQTTGSEHGNPPKHTEHILTLDTAYLLEHALQHQLEGQVIPYDFKSFWQHASPYLSIEQRFGLETNPASRQLLPYLILTQKDSDGVERYVNYHRIKGSGESRLVGGRSVGWGGHIEFTDLRATDNTGTIDLIGTLLGAFARETSEELTVEYHAEDGQIHVIGVNDWLVKFRFGYLIASTDAKVGQYHLGIVVEAEVHPELKFTSAEPDVNESAPMATIEELLADEKLEDWSRLFLTFKHQDANYDPLLGLIQIRTPMDDIIDKVGEENVTKANNLVAELNNELPEERVTAIKAELDELGFVNLQQMGVNQYRWGFDQAKLQAKLKYQWAEESVANLYLARQEGKTAVAEQITEQLASAGVVISEGEQGITWTYAEPAAPAEADADATANDKTLGETLAALGFASEEAGAAVDAANEAPAAFSIDDKAAEEPQAGDTVSEPPVDSYSITGLSDSTASADTSTDLPAETN